MRQIEVETYGRVAILKLSRPDAGNKITQDMADELTAALNAARSDKAISGCVLTGSGSVFCLGGDYRGAGPTSVGRMGFGRAHIDLFGAMAGLGKPLIAALNGHAHAGGFALALACDMVFATHDATLGLPEVAHGLFPFLALAVVRDALPKAVLFEIAYEARLMSAEDARARSLVNAVLPATELLPRAVETVERATAGHPDVLALGRDLYYATRGVPPAEALAMARFALGAALAACDP
ncbi:enoyl-CoA hydratase/isomerase family protein [Methylobacterium sp. E-046]|jgi:enoyl-CoA hydratase/carnithine racemase|uniref:enoyl-CoA hydratase/isomerase family protein n=1 Tax=Methylobacterium sp. E-046 TaxID=2836576 RepID=UPI001FB86B30|nr:enoyl-CoA hydratase/isomerase family protein [Methylobacterium sp. E-046]MCJ2097627.1 enoyl-CoA hydratase/isomerase family protein [Methylobacterium sp. E-046]